MYVKIVLYCSFSFFAAAVEFAFVVVERGMKGSVPSLGDMYYNM
jgi:hypothetical protein